MLDKIIDKSIYLTAFFGARGLRCNGTENRVKLFTINTSIEHSRQLPWYYVQCWLAW